jgi:hypothetical protein
MAQALAIGKHIPGRPFCREMNDVVMFRTAGIDLSSLLIERPVFETIDATHLAHPVVPLAYGLAGTLRIVWHSKDFAFLAKRCCQRSPGRSLDVASRPFFSRPVLAPSVIVVAISAAILASILPLVFCRMLHPELLAACRVLAD